MGFRAVIGWILFLEPTGFDSKSPSTNQIQ
jgi:hypothetical protein